jgi:N-acetylmuramoyl-L-alanine amidase
MFGKTNKSVSETSLETSGTVQIERRRFLQWLTAPAVMAILPDPVWAASVRIAAARLWPSTEYTRITLEASDPIVHQVRVLHQPDRIVLDLENLSFTPELQKLVERANTLQDRYLKAIRFGAPERNYLRMVLDLKEASHPQIFTLKPAGNYRHRLVIDLYPDVPYDPLLAMVEREALKNRVEPPSTSSLSLKRPAEPIDLSEEYGAAKMEDRPIERKVVAKYDDKDELLNLLPRDVWDEPSASQLAKNKSNNAKATSIAKAEQENKKLTQLAKVERNAGLGLQKNSGVLTIAIDPGHGGEDPGAIGQQQTFEKNVTLSIGKRLRTILDSHPNIRTMMTRDDDYFVPLGQRVQKARRVKADLFVSIHADAFSKPSARGSSVFVLSDHGASSAAAKLLAQKENASDLVGGVRPSSVQDASVARLLLDMSQTVTMNDSLKLAQSVLKQMGEVNTLHTSHVEQAGFAVLKAPDIPSILVETAFISNPEEEQKLRDDHHQERIANAITDGIKAYASKHPRLAGAMGKGELS